MVIAKKQDDSDSDGDVLTISSEKSCEVWLFDSAIAHSMQLQRRSGSCHASRSMVVLLTWKMIRVIVS